MKFAWKRTTVKALWAGLALAIMAAPASAQAPAKYPNKPIRIVLPYTPGGVSDAVTRLVAQHLSARVGQPVIVDNRPGANAIIGSNEAAKSAPDGYTLLVVVAAHVTNPHMVAKMPYDPLKELTGVSQVGRIPLLLVSSAKLPPTNLKELLAWGKANSGNVNFASSGNGSGAHLSGELFAQATGMKMTHIAYRGMAPALPDLFNGEVALTFDTFQTMWPHVKEGRLRAIGIASPTRWPAAPEVPTLAEAGLPGFNASSWIGVLAPAKTPAPIVSQLSEHIAAIMAMPEVKERFASFGIEPVGSTPQQFNEFILAESDKWGKVIRDANIRIAP